MPKNSRPDPSTLAIHAGVPPAVRGDPVTPPIYQAATFHGGGPGDDAPLRYTRYGNNPTIEMVGAKVAALEEMEAGLPLASGMAAITMTLLALTREGDHVLASSQLYGATRLFLAEELPRRGASTTFIDPLIDQDWRSRLRKNTRLLYLELPTNPTLRVVDPAPIAQLAREIGIPLVMDTTFASPINFRAGAHGADVVVHSATKYLGGHSDLTAGVVCGTSDFVREVQAMLRHYGPALDPHAAWLLDRGIRTLGVRMERHNESALHLARWFETQPEVDTVIHPGLPSHPDHKVAGRVLDGFGGMLGIVLKGGREAEERFCGALRLAAVAPSLGGVETLVSLPRLTSHRGVPAPERAAMGIPDGFVRLSIGLEGVRDLERDFREALNAVSRG